MTDKDVSIKDMISIAEAAEIMGYSRQHVLRLINSGKIEAKKVGRSFVVDRNSLGGVYKTLTVSEKKEVDQAVAKVFREYGAALKKLGKE